MCEDERACGEVEHVELDEVDPVVDGRADAPEGVLRRERAAPR